MPVRVRVPSRRPVQVALAVLQPAEWVLKSGFRLPMGGIYARLVVEDGVLVALEDIVPPDPAAGR